jgi:hypothetical protein
METRFGGTRFSPILGLQDPMIPFNLFQTLSSATMSFARKILTEKQNPVSGRVYRFEVGCF